MKWCCCLFKVVKHETRYVREYALNYKRLHWVKICRTTSLQATACLYKLWTSTAPIFCPFLFVRQLKVSHIACNPNPTIQRCLTGQHRWITPETTMPTHILPLKDNSEKPVNLTFIFSFIWLLEEATIPWRTHKCTEKTCRMAAIGESQTRNYIAAKATVLTAQHLFPHQ